MKRDGLNERDRDAVSTMVEGLAMRFAWFAAGMICGYMWFFKAFGG